MHPCSHPRYGLTLNVNGMSGLSFFERIEREESRKKTVGRSEGSSPGGTSISRGSRWWRRKRFGVFRPAALPLAPGVVLACAVEVPLSHRVCTEQTVLRHHLLEMLKSPGDICVPGTPLEVDIEEVLERGARIRP